MLRTSTRQKSRALSRSIWTKHIKFSKGDFAPLAVLITGDIYVRFYYIFPRRKFMSQYKDMTKEELQALKAELCAQYDAFKAKGLKLDMSRGKPNRA